MRNYLICLFTFCSIASQAQVPEWIWHSNNGAAATNNEDRFFHKTFVAEKKPESAILSIAADDQANIWVNGKKQREVTGWNNSVNLDITKDVKEGTNSIAIHGFSTAGEAAFIAKLTMSFGQKKRSVIVTDTSWKSAIASEKGWEMSDFSPGTNWIAAVGKGKLGVAPWGDVMKVAEATRAEDLTLLPGFKVELLHSAQAGEGTWICMTIDDKGRLIISPQADDLSLWRITLDDKGQISKMETIPAPIRQAMGLLYANESLYANGHGPSGTGLYRLVDKNKNDQFDTNEFEFLKTFKGEGEHGYHAVVEGPDKKIYVMNGNHTKIPDGLSTNSPHKNYDEDFLLPRQWDAGGHAVGILAPGGHVLRTDADGKNWELMLGGFRNTYDFAFNTDGEMFGFDSDMEWEWGMPWYKPTRILHCVSGADFGWRAGSAKWPAYYADGLPAAVNIGIGSPTGVKFGTKSNFPEKYKNALFAMDWSYGRILAVHLKPIGASYSATYENFVKGKPLNVTDLEFGQDGAMYFITGGRGTQSGLYRVSSEGSGTEEIKSRDELAAEKLSMEARKTRRQLEEFHGTTNPHAVETAWPFLKSEDRWLRYAARIAIEAQPVSQWKDRAINEQDIEGGLASLMALARVGGKETQKELLMALKKFPLDSLNETQKLEKLRVIELSFIRQGKPAPELAKVATEKLSAQYPAKTESLNRELCQLLIFLEAPGVVEKTLDLLDKAKTQEEQIHYIFYLRNLKTGWT
ncbi:MAG: heme-binding protein, partial [Verrucomicrobiota bacterium]